MNSSPVSSLHFKSYITLRDFSLSPSDSLFKYVRLTMFSLMPAYSNNAVRKPFITISSRKHFLKPKSVIGLIYKKSFVFILFQYFDTNEIFFFEVCKRLTHFFKNFSPVSSGCAANIPLYCILNSTRLFFALPCSVVLSATGLSAP